MEGKHFKAVVTVLLALVATITLRAEDLVSYRVSTDCVQDWDVLINGNLVVRHRPTGFGRCFYSGNLNRIVSGGTNTAELICVHGQTPEHKPEPGGCVRLEIRFLGDYRGEKDYEQLDTLVNFNGSVSTNLLFVVGRTVPTIVGGSVAPQESSDIFAGSLVSIGLLLYALFINLYGFSMVVSDRAATKRLRPRLSSSAFLWNAILGGGIGQLIAMAIKRHNTDKPVFTVGIPALVLLQIAIVIVFATRDFDLGSGILKPALRLTTSIKESGNGWTKFGRTQQRFE